MKITFPHMGNMYIPIKVLLDTVGIDYAFPPLCNKKTLELGVKHSPEFACLPFKTMLGNFIEGIEKGANFILMGGGCGQCRLGYYGELQREILATLGYDITFIYLDLSNMTAKEMLNKLKPITKDNNVFRISRGIIYALKTVFEVDRLYHLANYVRCREVNRGETDSLLYQFKQSIQWAKGYWQVRRLVNSTKANLTQIKINKDYIPLKIAIVGEMYAALEPYVNFNLEKNLGYMGVEIDNKVTMSHWIREHVIKKIVPIKIKNRAHEAGKEFMKTDDIGGHGLETIGNLILCSQKGYDGVIHVYPFTCMPEITAQSTFQAIQKKYPIPAISLIIDEMTGEAGYLTRIEAFVDMLKNKKDTNVVSNIYRKSDKKLFRFRFLSRDEIKTKKTI